MRFNCASKDIITDLVESVNSQLDTPATPDELAAAIQSTMVSECMARIVTAYRTDLEEGFHGQ